MIDLLKDFYDARRVMADSQWADAAHGELLRAGLPAVRIDDLLGEVLVAVRESQAGPEELFGPATAWAQQCAGEASQDGEDFVDPTVTAPAAVVRAMWVAALVSVFFAFITVRVGGWGRGLYASAPWFPLGFGIAVGLASLVHGALARRRSIWLARVAALAAASLVIVLTALVMKALEDVWLVSRGGVLVFLGEALMLFGIWWSLKPWAARRARVVTVRGPSAIDDAQWLELARAELGKREDLPPGGVLQLLEEAQEHARDAGTSLAAEFGNPVGYARQLPVDEVADARAQVWFWLAMSTFLTVLIGVHDHWHPTALHLVFLVISLACVALSIWGQREAVRIRTRGA
ncbi:hypothetical protein AAEX63_12825 [Luteococcus sp. H138]|uniref:hypothetical protein n=1 Tax=unclassified Luteococcus TaxID=2639923 RepID=UPI00313C7873